MEVDLGHAGDYPSIPLRGDLGDQAGGSGMISDSGGRQYLIYSLIVVLLGVARRRAFLD